MKRCGLMLTVVLLAACTAPTPLPDFRYYSLPAPTPLAVINPPLFKQPLVIEELRSSGVRGERPILYTSAIDRVKLLQYHYQLWTEPPTTLVQGFLVRKLGSAKLAPLVTDQLSLRLPALRIAGELTRFERTRSTSGWSAQVELRLRASDSSGEMPLLDRHYAAEIAASDENLESSVQAFQVALDQIADALVLDLREIAARPAAPAAAR